jgi:alpha-beta hydrolase superfamily lysophospholipase
MAGIASWRYRRQPDNLNPEEFGRARRAAMATQEAGKAHKRAMPIARLAGNGMDFADAVELHALVDAGLGWPEASVRLAARNLAHARRAIQRGHRTSARSWYLHASACFRFGQALLRDDDPRKRALYQRMLDAFRRGGELSDPPVERLELPWRGGRLTGWLLPSRQSVAHPFVIQLCGIGGSREEYEVGSRYLLERGLSVLLVDAPGQGETRLFEGLHLDEHVTKAISAVVDAALADPRCNGRVGLWGNSAGGWLAALAAGDDPRIAAVCMNGGTDRPTEILERFPRFVNEMQQMTGHEDPAQAREVVDRLTLDPKRLQGLRCPLHVVHGTPDKVFRVEGARRVYAGAASPDKTLTEYADGDHCVSNRSNEKHMLIADWFVDRLATNAAVARPRR